jgi:hypothetical protein
MADQITYFEKVKGSESFLAKSSITTRCHCFVQPASCGKESQKSGQDAMESMKCPKLNCLPNTTQRMQFPLTNAVGRTERKDAACNCATLKSLCLLKSSQNVIVLHTSASIQMELKRSGKELSGCVGSHLQ